MNVFLFHWNKPEAEELAHKIGSFGCKVDYEWEDGARGGGKVKIAQPEAVVFYLRRLPSHSRATAEGLRALKATRDIPIVFVDGEGEGLAKTKAKTPDAVYTTTGRLKSTLLKLAKSSRATAGYGVRSARER